MREKGEKGFEEGEHQMRDKGFDKGASSIT